jgi:membrane-associated phospholipid phosphatase
MEMFMMGQIYGGVTCVMQKTIVFVVMMAAWASGLCAQERTATTLPWEAAIVRDVNGIQSEVLRDVSKVTSDALLPLTGGIPLALLAIGHATDDRQLAMAGIHAGTTIVGTYLIVGGLKALIGRDRPYMAWPGEITNFRSDRDGSMPSGHSAGSMALAVSVSLSYPTWYVIGPAAAYTLLTGFSRMHLGMHYLTDVLTGYAIGAGVAVLLHHLRSDLDRIFNPVLPSVQDYSSVPLRHVPIAAISIGL